MQHYRDIAKKQHKLSNIIEPQIKTGSILKDNSMKVVYPLFFQMSLLETLAGSKNYVSIFPTLISRLLEAGFFNWVYQIFDKTRTSPFLQTTI